MALKECLSHLGHSWDVGAGVDFSDGSVVFSAGGSVGGLSSFSWVSLISSAPQICKRIIHDKKQTKNDG